LVDSNNTTHSSSAAKSSSDGMSDCEGTTHTHSEVDRISAYLLRGTIDRASLKLGTEHRFVGATATSLAPRLCIPADGDEENHVSVKEEIIRHMG
jgi:hypothetical protein